MHELAKEHRRLLAEHAALRKAHAALHGAPFSRVQHDEHAARLREHLACVQSFHDRLRQTKRHL